MQIFTYSKIIHLTDTDATGNIFFARAFDLSLETLENFFAAENFSLKAFLQEGQFLFPVVHASADFLSGLTAGDEIEIHLFVEKMGVSSVALKYEFIKVPMQQKCLEASIVHVAIDRKKNQSIPMPEDFKAMFLRNR
ncbi:MAG: hypothetical protein Tsb0015_09070 [Simkaniaceae bacterium]